MSVLIKNMDMPKTCRQCFLRANGCKERKYNEGRPNACPLVEVPTPHGRLVDFSIIGLPTVIEAEE